MNEPNILFSFFVTIINLIWINWWVLMTITQSNFLLLGCSCSRRNQRSLWDRCWIQGHLLYIYWALQLLWALWYRGDAPFLMPYFHTWLAHVHSHTEMHGGAHTNRKSTLWGNGLCPRDIRMPRTDVQLLIWASDAFTLSCLHRWAPWTKHRFLFAR